MLSAKKNRVKFISETLDSSRYSEEDVSTDGDSSPPRKSRGFFDNDSTEKGVDDSNDSYTSLEEKDIRSMVKYGSKAIRREVSKNQKDKMKTDQDGLKSQFPTIRRKDVLGEKNKTEMKVDTHEIDDDFENVGLPPELSELFECIDEYRPRTIDLKTELKCFIPPYIPASGDVDYFIKVPRPDGVEDGQGLAVIDEPSTHQSDAAVLELQLRAQMKKRNHGGVIVRSIENASRNQHEIDRWIDSTNDVHRSKPPPEVNYSYPMPEVQDLMDPLPEEFKNALESDEFKDALSPQIDLSLHDYAKVICSLLDVPVRDNNLIQSLHLLFNLLLRFRENVNNSDVISAL